jgi:small-conductance mechanosensitive channel
VLPVLDLLPVIAPAGAVGALAVLGDQTLETHAAGGVEQVWPDLSLL